MYPNGKHTLFMSLLLCVNLSACQSAINHQYSGEEQAEMAAQTALIPVPSLTVDSENSKTHQLQEEPILPMSSANNLPVLTPASYYHSPDPPQKLPEFVPSLFFDFDSWTLTDKGKHILELTATQLKNNPNTSLLIEGHCDNRGSEGYNLVLGDKRALTIQDYLISLGVQQDRLIPVSFGDTHPVCFEDHDTCHALNRRGYLVLIDPNAK